MNDPQIWTLIGVFAAIMLGGMSLMTTLLSRVITTEITGLRSEMNVRFDAVHAEMNARFAGVHAEMNARFTAVHAEIDARFTAVHVKIDHLDDDIAALGRKIWRDSPGE